MIEEHIQQQKKVSIKEPFYKKPDFIREVKFERQVLPHLETRQEIIEKAQDKYLHIKVEEVKKNKPKSKLKENKRGNFLSNPSKRLKRGLTNKIKPLKWRPRLMFHFAILAV